MTAEERMRIDPMPEREMQATFDDMVTNITIRDDRTHRKIVSREREVLET